MSTADSLKHTVGAQEELRYVPDGDGTPVRCWVCGLSDRISAPAVRLERATVGGVEGHHLEETCGSCGARLFVPDDGMLSPVLGLRATLKGWKGGLR